MTGTVVSSVRGLLNRDVAVVFLVALLVWYASFQQYGSWLNSIINPVYRGFWQLGIPFSLGESFLAQLLEYWVRRALFWAVVSLIIGNIVHQLRVRIR